MLEVGKAYSTKNKKRRFLILAKKNRPSSNGCNFIGEDTKSGTVAYFNHKGEHSFDADSNLECDRFRWLPMVSGVVQGSKFLRKEELGPSTDYSGFILMIDDDVTTIRFVSRANFELTYV